MAGSLGRIDTSGLADGNYEIRLVVRDSLGLTGSVTTRVAVDNEFPFADQISPTRVSASEGGHVYTVDQRVHLYFAPRSFRDDVVVAIEPLADHELPEQPTSSSSPVGSGFRVSLDGAPLDKPARLEIALPADRVPETVVLYLLDEDSVWHRSEERVVVESSWMDCTSWR